MRRSFFPFFRFMAFFLAVSILTSGIAMSAYVCPQTTLQVEKMEMSMNDEPCTVMDKQKPVQCGEFQSGGQIALEHLAAPPALAPIFVSFIFPVSLPSAVTSVPVLQRSDFPLTAGTDPPYLRTQRLRI